jgi:FlaA1/EpsC-like NDP-sugar epimerase
MEGLMKIKKLILVFIDMALIMLSYLSAFYFIFQNKVPQQYSNSFMHNIIAIICIYIILLYIFRLYESLWRYASIDEFVLGIGGCVVAELVIITYCTLIGAQLPYNISILSGIFSVIYIVGFRMSFRIYRRFAIQFSRLNKKNYKRVMVIGAGSAGTMIINEMKRSNDMKYDPVALIDDDKYKKGSRISGVKVLGDRYKIKEITRQKHIDEIIISIPSLTSSERKELVDICKETSCKIKIMPALHELINGNITMKQIRDVDVEDLLGRESISLDNEGISEYLNSKTVLVTGGGGSIGSELCRQIAKFKPKQLLILDVYENNAYDLQNELKFKYPNLQLKVLIGSVRDKRRLEKIFNEYKPEIVFHAAAHKHVPLMEDNPTEAIKNNVFGTMNLAEQADRFRIQKFVLISTDKAVNPTNIMGASKRICEMIVQSMNRLSKTDFVAVRFGNVLGSNGSVIPLFKKQIANGGPVTVTDKNVIRYFMTIPEAAQLVLQAGSYAEGGEIFVLDMGKPVKIYDLACDLIKLSGFEPHKDISINISGLRPGEKLYEELLTEEEGLNKTEHNKIFVAKPTFTNIKVLRQVFKEIEFVIENGSKEELINKICELVPTYNYTTYPCDMDSVREEVAQTLIQTYKEQVT